MSKTRVLHVINKLAPGGAEAVVVNLVNHMNNDLFESRVCALVPGGVLKESLHNSQATLIEMNKKEGNDFFLPFKLSLVIRKYKPDVVHTHCWGSLVEGYIAAILAGVPVVVHSEHGTIQDKYHNKIIQRYLWRLHHVIIAVSAEHRERLSKVVRFPRDRIRVVYNGVDTKKFQPMNRAKRERLRARYGLGRSVFCVGTVGRLEPVKDQATLIRAFASFNRNYPESRLLLIGEGSLHDQLKEIVIDLKIEESVMFLGYRSDTAELLNVLDVFVLPSISEGTSCTLLESMSTGLPIIATHVGGNPEIVQNGETGILVPAQNPAAIARGLTDLRDRFGEANRSARDRIVECFSIEKMVDRHRLQYKRALEKSQD